MSSIGSGVSAPTPPWPDADNEAAAQLAAELHTIADESGFALPDWLSSLDSADNVAEAITKALESGHITTDELKGLVAAAYDFSKMQPAERRLLEQVLTDHATRFDFTAREALSQFLNVPDPLHPDSQPYDLGLPEVAGQRLAVQGQGYMVNLDAPYAGPPGLHGEGAERIYRGGQALATAPKGVVKQVPAEVQIRMVDLATAQYDAALSTVYAEPLSPTDANKVRSGSAATLMAVMEGAATPQIREEAAAALLSRAMHEPVEGLRANIYFNLEANSAALTDVQKQTLGDLKTLVLPTKPPYDAWFPTGNETFNVVQYAHPQCWDGGRNPVKAFEDMGLTVTSHTTNERGEETWVLEGVVRGDKNDPNSPGQPTRATVVKSHDEFVRDIDDPNMHAIFYTGHSNLGGNVSEAIRRGPEENGQKMLSFLICRGQQNIFEVANKYPNAQLTTTLDPHYFANMDDAVEGRIRGVARRDTYDNMDAKTTFSGRWEKIDHFITPSEAERYRYTDLDFDGQPELGLDGTDRFYDVISRVPSEDRTDLVPRAEARAASDIDGTAVMHGVNFARTLITYHLEKGGIANSPLKGRMKDGDRFEAAGWFEGSGEAVRIEQTRGEDGKPVYNVSVNKAYADQSAYAIGALVQYEILRQYGSKDGTFSKEDNARALVMAGEYLAYMYVSRREANAIVRSIGKRAGADNLTFDMLRAAIDVDDHGYTTDKQVAALLENFPA